jgi:hypothetical protein
VPDLPNSFADILDFLDRMKGWQPVGLGVENTEQIELSATMVEQTVSRIRAYVEWRSTLPLPGDAAYLAGEYLPVNAWPLNQAALKWLRAAKTPLRDDLPYLVQLLDLGFTRNLAVPGRGNDLWSELEQEAGLLLGWHLDPVRLTHWFVNNPDGGDETEQDGALLLRLEEAQDSDEAAQQLMEWFYDRISAENNYYR